MTKINCLNPIAACGLDMLTDNYEMTDTMAEAEAVLVRSAVMHDMDLPEHLLAIARAGAGVNNIPLEKCADQGIVVFNTPGANANGVKELVIASMLLAARDITGGIQWCQENKGDAGVAKSAEKAKKAFAGTEIKGKKLGIIGLGAIGVLVANAANRLGMDVYGCDPYLSVEHALNMSRDVTMVKTNEELYAICDYITVHVPLLDSTKGMFNKEAFAKMKDGVVLVNTSRGGLVKTEDLIEGIRARKFCAVGLDVYEEEKRNVYEDRSDEILESSITSRLLSFPNVLITSHQGFFTEEALGAISETTLKNAAAFAKGESTGNEVE